ncbi:hypothetical protein Taro_027725 [Colocasia esculenta]|uniref:Uncharacterized protein n=1 Tax=Colocasia esculenta TaxID=4460 RepID=A0A843VS97_COLES|nr:hypothetical protein [Colocasia esculenta]
MLPGKPAAMLGGRPFLLLLIVLLAAFPGTAKPDVARKKMVLREKVRKIDQFSSGPQLHICSPVGKPPELMLSDPIGGFPWSWRMTDDAPALEDYCGHCDW